MVKGKLINHVAVTRPALSRNQEKPAFSFEYLQDNSIKGALRDQSFTYDFLNHLREISKKTWTEILNAPKHSLIGVELLPLDCFIPRQFPSIVTDDVKKLMVFRATGDNRVFVGVKTASIFYVIFIETKFNDIEKH